MKNDVANYGQRVTVGFLLGFLSHPVTRLGFLAHSKCASLISPING